MSHEYVLLIIPGLSIENFGIPIRNIEYALLQIMSHLVPYTCHLGYDDEKQNIQVEMSGEMNGSLTLRVWKVWKVT